MDLRKEIKLSDLVPKRRQQTEAKAEPEPKPETNEVGKETKRSGLFSKRRQRVEPEVHSEVTTEPEAKAKKPKKAKSAPKGRRTAGTSEIVGLKIGATGISAAQVVNNGTKEVVRVARGPLPHGVVDGGEVRDPVALGHALSEFFAQHSLPRRGVRLGLANSRIGVRVIEVAGIDDEAQLGNAIGFRAHEMLSVPVEESVMDYHVLSVDTDETGTTTRKILLVVAYRESVDRYLEATDAAKLTLAGIDLEAFALLRTVQNPDADGSQGVEAAVVAVNIGHERTTLAISDHGVCSFARVLEWGGANIGTAVGRALKLTPAEAEEHKHNLSLEAGREGVAGLPPDKSREAVEATRYELQNLVRELLSSLRFHQGQPGSLPLARILITGGTSNIPGLAAELERELRIPVSTVDPLSRFQLAEGVELPDHPGAFAVALGLGIED
jgi:type IV pilus assembly protein PilM